MIGTLDHVGYLVGDLDAAVAEFVSVLGLAVVRRFERPEFSVRGVYLGPGEGSVELFTFTDEALLAERLGQARVLLDHVAYAVSDIDAVAARMSAAGVRFAGPDLRGELHEPVDLGGVRHLWTVPESSGGAAIQLLQR
jgi:catechol 2,3-dioxygenase-like lactoylglutathione lyase family enzyme